LFGCGKAPPSQSTESLLAWRASAASRIRALDSGATREGYSARAPQAIDES